VRPGFKEENPQSYFLLRQISRINPPRPRDFLHPDGWTPPPPPPGLPAGQAGAPPRRPVHERLAEAAMPVFFLVGEHDKITPPDLIEMCHRLVPGSRYHLVRGSGHSAYWEKPDEFNERVLDFLRSVDRTPPAK
jgi:pimeloyl-ACP methyl ester carboxylesterase